MAVVIHFKDGKTVLLRRAVRVEEVPPGTPRMPTQRAASQLTFVCYDAEDQVIGRFDIHDIRGYYLTTESE